MDKTPILIVGGAGYIGSHCAKVLSKKGYPVINYDNLSRGFRDAVKYGEFIEGDIGDRAKLDQVFKSHAVGAVMHFAAFAYVGESMEKPEMYMNNNYEKTRVLLEAMTAHKVMNFIFSSTCATYGVPVRVPIDEKHPQAPVNPYGESKLLVEQMLGSFDENAGLKSVSLRYFNAAGCDPDGELGERHDPETHLIPLAIRAALGTGPSLRIFGRDYKTPDGTCVRDYIHVNDLAEAHVLALEFLLRRKKRDAFNLGNGRGFSVLEIVRAVESVTGKKVPVEQAPRRAGDPPVLVADAAKAERVLKWKTRFPDIADIIRTAHAWEAGR
jgi:UDP-glucose-4-epimerase GalE